MNPVLVDANVLLDIFCDDPAWADWSEAQLNRAAQEFDLVINPVIYAEVGIGFQRIEELETALGQGGFHLMEIPREALFLAGKAFLRYRQHQGAKRSPLPDFFIGAHAAVCSIPLVTRDASRYRTYFPTVELICP
jgi:predicted nucleic acid-binding protein